MSDQPFDVEAAWRLLEGIAEEYTLRISGYSRERYQKFDADAVVLRAIAARLRELERDAERMDWLSDANNLGNIWYSLDDGTSIGVHALLRKIIDDARAGVSPETPK